MNNRTPKRYYSDRPLVALDRYQPRVADDDFRDCHAAVPRADEVELIKVGTR